MSKTFLMLWLMWLLLLQEKGGPRGGGSAKDMDSQHT
jgi:hypothetical protein